MTTQLQPPSHRVSRVVAAGHAALDGLAEVPVWSMDAAEAGETLTEIGRLRARSAELELRVATQADTVDVGAADGATSTAAWWAHRTRQTRQVTHHKLRLARALDRWQRVRAALAAGDLDAEQARVLVHALEALPDDLDADTLAQAEERLVTEAQVHDPKALRILGRRILDVVAPEVADAHEAKLLDDEEREARQACRLTMSADGHGTVHGRFTLPAAQAAMLRKALEAIASGRHQAARGELKPETPRPTPERLGHAFAEYIETYPAEELPQTGGSNATVVVTMSLATLLGGLAAAKLDAGERLSPGQARRLACQAGIIPAVLDGAGQPLDLGRQRRFHTKTQRIALALRDAGCTAEGCDAPPGSCHAHHDTPWSRGGATTVADGRLLCPRHHTLAHDPDYEMTRHPDGTIRFHRRE